MEPKHLQTFCHQVGGGKSIMKYDKTTICKLFNTREHYFYMNMPQDLKEFTPEFRGLIEVTLQEDNDDYIQYIGYPSDSTKQSERQKHISIQQNSIFIPENCPYSGHSFQIYTTSSSPTYRQRLGSGSSCSDQERPVVLQQDNSSTGNNRIGNGVVSTDIRTTIHTEDTDVSKQNSHWINPWIFESQERLVSKIKSMRKTSNQCKFILLENLTAKFKYPCVLDMKMGTRQYGDDDNEEKKQKYIRKCQTSTSSIIGTRIDGMQVYQTRSEKYISHDKYYGRYLSLDRVKQTLYQFLHNGCELRTDVISAIIVKLEKLYRILNKQDGFRFYSSSLLIIYEGYQSSEDVKKDQKSNGPTNADVYNCDYSKRKNEKFHNCKIDVWMIDFAHSTHADLQESKAIYVGPDAGYLFGLRHLIELLTQIKHE